MRLLALVFLVNVQCAMCARLKYQDRGEFHGSGSHVEKKFGFETAPCEPLDQQHLARVLGAAYNPRYMSVVEPPDKTEDDDQPGNPKRDASGFRTFSVDEDFSREVDQDVPAWEVDHVSGYNARSKRSPEEHGGHGSKSKRAAGGSKPWQCKSKVKWLDLGFDYFPRYIRTVECEKHSCWYGVYQCKPKSFTVKMLRRKNGRCAYRNRNEGSIGLPQDLKELWIWEERAVNFCCECSSV